MNTAWLSLFRRTVDILDVEAVRAQHFEHLHEASRLVLCLERKHIGRVDEISVLFQKSHRNVEFVDEKMDRAEFTTFRHEEAADIDIGAMEQYGEFVELSRGILQHDVDLFDFHDITSNCGQNAYIDSTRLNRRGKAVVSRKGLPFI
jgi:hypothetical protein